MNHIPVRVAHVNVTIIVTVRELIIAVEERRHDREPNRGD